MSSVLIVNANVVNEGDIKPVDVLLCNGRIERIDNSLSVAADQVMDAEGCFLIPGMIDDQVHFREPGLEDKGNFVSESRAAVAGGVTSFLDMPNTVPITLHETDIQDKMQRAQGRSLANFGFYLGASHENLEVIKALDPNLACGISVFMGSACMPKLIDDLDTLEQIFTYAPILVAAHCEDTPTILENEESYRSIYGDTIPVEFHSQIRSEEACYLASSQAIALAQQYDARLHILHISTARELDLLQSTTLADKRITAEVCPHYLYFSDEDYVSKASLIKTAPAIKTSEDRAALIQGLLEGRLDLIGSGHAPHLWAEKQGDDYFAIPPGAPWVQHALLSVLEHYHDGILSLEHIVEKTSHAVAQLFDIHERGFIREGYWADLVLLDLAETTATHASTLYKVGWTAYAGNTFRSRIAATWVNGQLVWQDGQLVQMSEQAPGQALSYQR
ncbi:MAG: dihydroorotase [Proteobacteria bacterium]|nr:MAG: dihydroorotase [Pseudomonadota bacterium]